MSALPTRVEFEMSTFGVDLKRSPIDVKCRRPNSREGRGKVAGAHADDKIKHCVSWHKVTAGQRLAS